MKKPKSKKTTDTKKKLPPMPRVKIVDFKSGEADFYLSRLNGTTEENVRYTVYSQPYVDRDINSDHFG